MVFDWLLADWPAPPWIKAGSTGRTGGLSQAPYGSLNLADHVGDDIDCVRANRARLNQYLHLPTQALWLNQVHGIDIIDATIGYATTPTADASFSTQKNTVCAVLTADCLPLLLCDINGSRIAAVHAGWRGLLGGIIETTVHRLACPANQLLAWLGPAIGPQAFEVGSEVRQAFIARDKNATRAFESLSQNKWLADLNVLAKQRLEGLGVKQIYGGHCCTYSNKQRFFSYRRDGVTGRMATLIWMEDELKET